MKRVNVLVVVVALILTGCTESPKGGTPSIAGARTSQQPVHGALVRAVAAGDVSRARALLKQGADINENVGTETEEITPLLAAIATGNETIAVYLAERGAVFHSMFHGYRPRDYSLSAFGDSSRISRILTTVRIPMGPKAASQASEGEKLSEDVPEEQGEK